MRQLVKWGVPAIISGRTYYRGSIKLPDLNLPVDVMLMNQQNDRSKIGEAYLIENEEGLFVKNINWYIDIDYLREVMDKWEKHYREVFAFQIEREKDWKYDREETICLMGTESNEYKDNNCLEFVFIARTILSDEPIHVLLRDVKLGSIVTES